MRLSVILPICNAERFLAPLLNSLLSQTVSSEIVVIDSGSTDGTLAIAAQFADRIRLLQIPREAFDHGGTRDAALRQSSGDYVVFLTQDALPVDKYSLENLLDAFSGPQIAAVYGRQIARPDAPAYEQLIREFNYPSTGRVWCERDIPRYGIRAYFFSDTFSAYRRDAYEAAGGFDHPITSNEDMIMAAKLLHAGYSLAYTPVAAVWHSHRSTLREDYRRHVLSGHVMQEYREHLSGAQADAEGLRMVRFVVKGLLRRGQFGSIPVFLAHIFARLLGNRVGKGKKRL